MLPPPASPRANDHARAAALRRAAVQAAHAPSVLNTQPWRLRIHDGALYVHADRDRQLAALDPQRRVLTASVGCAVLSARAALASDGYGTVVSRFPEPLTPDLVAVITPSAVEPDTDLPPLGAEGWATDPRPTDDDPETAAEMPPSLVAALRAAVAAEGVQLHVLDDRERAMVSELNRQADEIENLDLTYRAEIDAWTTHDVHHRERVAAAHECFAVVVTEGDTTMDWLRAGEAMMRMLQVAVQAGHVLSPSTQVVEVPSARAQLRRALHLDGHAHVLLRAGRGNGSTVVRRRRLVDVLVEEA
jgi:hypothetical protein